MLVRSLRDHRGNQFPGLLLGLLALNIEPRDFSQLSQAIDDRSCLIRRHFRDDLGCQLPRLQLLQSAFDDASLDRVDPLDGFGPRMLDVVGLDAGVDLFRLARDRRRFDVLFVGVDGQRRHRDQVVVIVHRPLDLLDLFTPDAQLFLRVEQILHLALARS